MRNECFQQVNGDRPGVENIAIVIIDGPANRDVDQTIPNADIVKHEGVRIIAVGVTHVVYIEDYLRAIASPSTAELETVFAVSDFTDLAGIAPELLSFICVKPTTNTTVSTTPGVRPAQGKDKPEWCLMSVISSHVITIRVRCLLWVQMYLFSPDFCLYIFLSCVSLTYKQPWMSF